MVQVSSCRSDLLPKQRRLDGTGQFGVILWILGIRLRCDVRVAFMCQQVGRLSILDAHRPTNKEDVR